MRPFTVTLSAGQNVPQSSMRLARLIVDRWMPDHAGGVHLLITPKLAQAITSVWPSHGDKRFRIMLQGNVPSLIELS